MRKMNIVGIGLAVFLAGLIPATGRADSITVGDHFLLPDTAGQTVTISIVGDTQVAGFDLFAQVGDGGAYNLGSNTGPVIQNMDTVTGTIFSADNTGQQNDPTAATHPLIWDSGVTTNNGTTVLDNGLLITATFDTTGLFSGTFPLDLDNVASLNGGPFTTDLTDSSGDDSPLTITDGSLIITSPSAVPLPNSAVVGSSLLALLSVIAVMRRRLSRAV